MNQQVRIIGGTYRGKKLPFPAIPGLRPTPDRIKETLFNWLMHDIRQARCLDAFAGSGALGFEAFSRGAGEVTFVEQNRAAVQNLLQICQSFKTPVLTVVQHDTLQFLDTCKKTFDIIFLDPPFSGDFYEPCLNLILTRQLLTPNGLIYIESPGKPQLDAGQWQTIKLKQAGQVWYGLFALVKP